MTSAIKRPEIWIALAGLCFCFYLYLAHLAIPGGKGPGHYNVGNRIIEALFFSYAIFTYTFQTAVVAAMYITYVYVTYFRRKRAALILFLVHYGIAFFVVVPFQLHRDPGLFSKTKAQAEILLSRPFLSLFCTLPFLVANILYLSTALRSGHRSSRD
jgi:hypothetical protein